VQLQPVGGQRVRAVDRHRRRRGHGGHRDGVFVDRGQQRQLDHDHQRASGTGLGTVAYTVAGNPSTSPRTGTTTIAGIIFTVRQAGSGCNAALSPTSASAPSTASTSSLSVVVATGCSWTATSTVGWITITAGASGSGSGTVTYAVAANTTGSARAGTLTVFGLTFTITQAQASAPDAPQGLRIVIIR